jgi:hypothetical protein
MHWGQVVVFVLAALLFLFHVLHLEHLATMEWDA